MTEARHRADSARIADLMAWIGNTSFKYTGSPFKAADFLPRDPAAPTAKVNVRDLKDVLLGMKPRAPRKRD